MAKCASCEERSRRALEELLRKAEGRRLAAGLKEVGMTDDQIADLADTSTQPDIKIYAKDEKWEDLTKRGYQEVWREYVFNDMTYRIEGAIKLIVKRKPEGDSHRIIDHFGVVHYVPVGWRAIRFQNGDEDRHLS